MTEPSVKVDGRWPPRQNDMPNLSNLYNKNILNFSLNLTLGRFGPQNTLALSLFICFIRLVDKTITEYELARAALDRFITTPRNTISPLYQASSHMENCINGIKRASRFAEKLRRSQHLLTKPFPINLTVLDKQVGLRITRVSVMHP